MGKSRVINGEIKMENKEKISGDEYLFELVTFLAASARGCIDEPHLYGPFRLLDALSKLLDLPKYASCLTEDPFFKKIKEEIDEKKFLVMTDVEGFKNFIDHLILELTRELKKRSLK